MSTLKVVRGTRDLLPPETALWSRIEAVARAVFARYNFGEIRTLVFEVIALLALRVLRRVDRGLRLASRSLGLAHGSLGRVSPSLRAGR